MKKINVQNQLAQSASGSVAQCAVPEVSLFGVSDKSLIRVRVNVAESFLWQCVCGNQSIDGIIDTHQGESGS